MAFTTVVTAHSRPEMGSRVVSPAQRQIGVPPKADLIKLIEDASSGEGYPAVLAKLRALPRTELYSTLNRIGKGLDFDDALRVKIAFVSCHLGFDYNFNRQILASSLTRKPRYRQFWAHETASLITGLLATRRDPILLSALLNSTEWSDGALSEELAEAFETQAQDHTTFFLSNLRTQSPKRRRRVYRLFKADSQGNTLKPVQDRLASIPRTSRLRPIAKEMLKAIS